MWRFFHVHYKYPCYFPMLQIRLTTMRYRVSLRFPSRVYLSWELFFKKSILINSLQISNDWFDCIYNLFFNFSLSSPFPTHPTLCPYLVYKRIESSLFCSYILECVLSTSAWLTYQVTHLSLRSMPPQFDYMSHLGCFCHVLLKPTRLNNKCIADRPVGGSMGSAYIHVHME